MKADLRSWYNSALLRLPPQQRMEKTMRLFIPMPVVTSALTFVASFIILFPAPALAEDRHEDHEALRHLLKQSVEALNSGNIESLRGFVTPDVLVTTVEQQRSGGFDDFKRYYDSQFNAPDATLSTISFQPVADEVTKFLDPNVGVVSGTSTDTYKFKDGEVREMSSRWTSTVIKDGTQWKIAAIHFGVNFLENPVVDAMRSYILKIGIGCVVAGLIIGALMASRFGRRIVPRAQA